MIDGWTTYYINVWLHFVTFDLYLNFRLWFTITKNFGNVLPVDWFATYARQLQEKALEIKQANVCFFMLYQVLYICIYIAVQFIEKFQTVLLSIGKIC